MLAHLVRLGCLVLGLTAFFHSSAIAAEPRVALVIGNSDYGPGIGKLLNPANDAKLMADTLQGLGFSVDLVLDADQKAMKRAIKAFGAKLEESGKDTTGLFYYAGHGVQVEGQNFLLPVGAEIEREADVEIESISADDVTAQMQFAGNAVNLIFLDACRNNPLARASRSGTRGLARLDAPRGSFVGYSTAPGDVAADGDGANSPYAMALAAELSKPGLSVDEAHRNVRAKVLAWSGNKQTPWDSSSLTGPVILAAKAAEAGASPATASDSSAEIAFWESVKDSNDTDQYWAYLQQYPAGAFVPLAQAKIAKLAKPEPTSSQQAAVASVEQVESDDPNHVSPLADGTIVLTSSTSAALATYLSANKFGTGWSSYFYVSLDGRSAYGAVCDLDCSKNYATGIIASRAMRTEAQEKCKLDASTECVMLFHDNSEKRDFKVDE